MAEKWVGGTWSAEVLEQIHRLDGDDSEWITAAAAAAFPEVESEQQLALRVQLDERGWHLIDAPGTARDLEALIRLQMRHFTAEMIGRLLREMPTCVTLAQLADEMGAVATRWDSELADFVWLKVWNGRDQLLLVGAAYEQTQVVSAPQRRRWETIGAHMTAAFQLRRALRRRGALDQAVLTLDGRIARVPCRDPRQRLRERVAALDHRAGSVVVRGNEPLWEPLVEGRCTLVDCFDAAGKHFVVAAANPVVEGRPDTALDDRERDVAQLAAVGMTNEDIADTLGLSRTAVSTALSQAMALLGVPDRALLPLIFDDSARTHRWTVGGVELIVGVHELRVPESLTPAETEVALLAIRGLSNAAIAEQRGSSARTVANLMRRVYSKRGLSNRTELVRDMVRVPPCASAASATA